MFGSPRSLLTPKKAAQEAPPDISPLLAAELGLEFASLQAPNNCPHGMYVTPSEETLLRWHGVFFVHRGPYAGSVLRFALIFPTNYPQSAPTVRFSSDVFHPMVDPKTKVWHPRGRLTQWRPRIDHVPHLLHSLKTSFKAKSLESIVEEEAINKHVWSLYHHSQHTFLSMMAQRAANSASQSALYPSEYPQPPSPTTPRTRKTSQNSLGSDDGIAAGRGMIVFKELKEGERERLWSGLKASLDGD
ncbi:hypothetical protein IAT38_002866 [Cryptococcus sp. DSM 104549]